MKWQIEGKNSFEGKKLYSSLRLSDGSFALGSIAHGLIWIDSDGMKSWNLIEPTIFNNTILSLFEDKNQNLWLGLDNGVDCVNVNSFFRV